MTLGCGSFGSPLPSKRLEKHWPSNRSKTQYEIGRIAQKDMLETLFIIWLQSGKFYGAEHIDETDN